MPDKAVLITPQNETRTDDVTLTAKWARIYEEFVKADFETGTLNHVISNMDEVEGFMVFVGLQLERDPNSIPEGYSLGDDVVPMMSAATTGGVIVSDSGNLGIGYEGWKAFDNNPNTRWGVAATSGIVIVELSTAKVIAGYSIRARNDEYLIDSPKNWNFEGSSDGIAWTVLDTQVGQISWSQNERKVFSISSPASYRYYRLNISSNQSGTNTSVSEIELLEGVPYGLKHYSSGYRIVGPIALMGTAIGDETIRWTLGEMPDGTSIEVSCALTDDETPPTDYTVATNNVQCPVISANDYVTGKYLWIKQKLITTDIDVTPSLMTMEIQTVFGSADFTIELDRTTIFSGRNLRTTTVSALPCGAATSWKPEEVYDGFLYWRAKAVNPALGIDTLWSAPQMINLSGGLFPRPRYFNMVSNRIFSKLPVRKILTLQYNRGFGRVTNRRIMCVHENRGFGKLRAARALYTELNITDDPPFPYISALSVTRGQAGSVLTLYGNGFGYSHTEIDLGNVNRYLRCYGGFVYINDRLCNVIEWSWEEIKFQIPNDAQTGAIKVQLTAPTVRDSNVIGFEVYEGRSADDVGIEFFLCDKSNPNVIVRQLDGAWNKAFQMVQNNPGSGSFSISRYDDAGGDTKYLADDNLILVKLDGNSLFKWIIESRKPNYVDSNEQQIIEVSGRGILSMLSRAVVYPQSMGNPQLDRQFTGTASTVLRTLILEAKARGGLVGVTVDWEPDTDSLGNTFTEDINLSFHVGTPLLEVATKFTDGLGYFDIDMTPELVLKIYKNKGLDLHDTVIYRPGQAIVSHQNQSDSTKLVNEVLVEGGDKLLAIASHSDSQAAYGRREGYLSASNIKDGLSEYGQAYLSRTAYPMWGIQGTVTKFADQDGKAMKPFETYLIGDWIGWKIDPEGSDKDGFNEKLKVRGITVSEDNDTGNLSYVLELHNTILEHEIRLSQKVERMSQYSGTDVLSVAPSSSGTYSESEISTMLASKANTIHSHDDAYSQLEHTHKFLDLSDTPESYAGQGTKVIAVKADGSGLEFVVGGGGTAYYENEIDKPPVTPNLLDDEFTMTSLDSKWLWINQSTAKAVPDGRTLKISAPRSGTVCRGIVQARPAVNDFTVVTKFLGCNYWANYAKAGLIISESLSGKQLGIWHAYDNAWKGLMGEFFSSPSARSSYSYYGPPVIPNGGYIKARIYYTTAWYADLYYSLNGYNWMLSKSALALGFIPSYVGLGIDFTISIGTEYEALYDWFRVTQA